MRVERETVLKCGSLEACGAPTAVLDPGPICDKKNFHVVESRKESMT
jgi:hypothetical protein